MNYIKFLLNNKYTRAVLIVLGVALLVFFSFIFQDNKGSNKPAISISTYTKQQIKAESDIKPGQVVTGETVEILKRELSSTSLDSGMTQRVYAGKYDIEPTYLITNDRNQIVATSKGYFSTEYANERSLDTARDNPNLGNLSFEMWVQESRPTVKLYVFLTSGIAYEAYEYRQEINRVIEFDSSVINTKEKFLELWGDRYSEEQVNTGY